MPPVTSFFVPSSPSLVKPAANPFDSNPQPALSSFLNIPGATLGSSKPEAQRHPGSFDLHM